MTRRRYIIIIIANVDVDVDFWGRQSLGDCRSSSAPRVVVVIIMVAPSGGLPTAWLEMLVTCDGLHFHYYYKRGEKEDNITSICLL